MATNDTDSVAQVKARLDILDVVGGYVSLHRSGRQHVGLCPFHAEKTPSFSVSQEKQSWYCHGCQDGGDIFTFVQKIERVDFPRALDVLAERAGVEVRRDPKAAARGARRRRSLELNALAARYFEYVLWNSPAGEPGRRLLEERGVGDALARRFHLGFAPPGGPSGDALVRYLRKHGATAAESEAAGLADRSGRDHFRGRLVFPIADERGQVLGFGGRALGEAQPKYLNTGDTDVYHKSLALFGLDQAREALRERRVAVLVEGYFDVLAAHAADVANAVAASGTALTREQIRVIARHADRVVLCFDGDGAGRRAAARAVELCDAEKLPARIAVMPSGVKDPDELVRRDPALLTALVAEAAPDWDVLRDWAIGDGGTTAEERRAASERVVAVLSSISDPAQQEAQILKAIQQLELHEIRHSSEFRRRVAARQAARSRHPHRLDLAAAAVSPETATAAPLPQDEEGPGDQVATGPPLRLPAGEEYLAALAVQQPGLARVLIEEMGLELDDLTMPPVRRLVEAALALPAGAGFPLHSLLPADRRLAASLAVREVPELGGLPDPVALQRAMADSVSRVWAAARDRRARREIRELLPVASRGDEEETVELRRIREVIAEQRQAQP